MAGKRKRSALVEAFHFVTAGIFADPVAPPFLTAAECAARVRLIIAAVPVLKSGAAIPPPSDVIGGDALIAPGLGFFNVPDIDENFLMGPKGERGPLLPLLVPVLS